MDIRLFASERLRTDHGLRAAHDALDALLRKDELESLHLMVGGLMNGPPNLFEYIIAVASE